MKKYTGFFPTMGAARLKEAELITELQELKRIEELEGEGLLGEGSF